MRRTTQQTFSAINFSSQQKTTNVFFSSQVRKQFKLLTVPLKPLRCCLRNDKLVNCHVWKFYKDLFWFDLSIKSHFLMVSSLISWFCWDHFVCIYQKNYSFQSRWIAALGIFSHYSPRFQRIIVKYDTKAEFNNRFIIHSKYPIPGLKTWLKHAHLHRSIDVKFIFDSARLGCSAPQTVSK